MYIVDARVEVSICLHCLHDHQAIRPIRSSALHHSETKQSSGTLINRASNLSSWLHTLIRKFWKKILFLRDSLLPKAFIGELPSFKCLCDRINHDIQAR